MGGLMIYGIPSFKLEKEVVIRRSDLLAESGVVYHPDTEVGAGVGLDELRARHDAALIATGVYKAREIMCPGLGLDGIYPALDSPTASNPKGLGDPVRAFADGTLDPAIGRASVRESACQSA